MSLFWYPSINNAAAFIDDKGEINKKELINNYVLYFLNRLQSMFEYEGLPETIPQKWLEHYLLVNGNCAIVKVDNELYAVTGGMGEDADPYYIPAGYVVANPWIKTSGGTLSKTYWTETIPGHKQDAVLMRNDTYSVGLMPMLQKYASQLAENDISMILASILARATINISAADDRTKKSAELWLKRLTEGKLGIISETAFIEALNVREFQHVAESLVPLIEYHQYIKASLYNDLGLNANYNMKRESLNSNESQLNDDMLRPLIDNMLAMRREACEEINKFYGTDITVDYNSAWLSNMIEEVAELNAIEAQGEASEEVPEEITEEVTEETTEEVTEETTEEVPEKTTEEVTEETTEEVPEETINELINAVDELTETVDELTNELGGEDNNGNADIE